MGGLDEFKSYQSNKDLETSWNFTGEEWEIWAPSNLTSKSRRFTLQEISGFSMLRGHAIAWPVSTQILKLKPGALHEKNTHRIIL